MLDEGEKIVPGFSRVRALRAWAGVRPLYEENEAAEGREAKRTFAVLDHATRDGVGGFATVVGGKFTTYRMMAERTADLVCAQLGAKAACRTTTYVLPDPHRPDERARPHWPGHRLEQIEMADALDPLICECELVTRSQLVEAARANPHIEARSALDDLRRDLRLGMGPCQGGFCNYRAGGVLHATGSVDAAQADRAIGDFAQRRWKGQRPLLWGQSLRQALLDEHIYRSILGLDALCALGGRAETEQTDGG